MEENNTQSEMEMEKEQKLVLQTGAALSQRQMAFESTTFGREADYTTQTPREPE